MNINIHENIKNKLDFFVQNEKIPHIIFHGPSGSGKRHVLNYLINKIYHNTNDLLNQYIMYVNCAHSKGIRFIRDELKFFAKTNINNKNGYKFKSIILFNCEKLTTDAQSALRRCIEKFSHNTRFFIIVEDETTLLKPILSRFCNIFIPLPNINGEKISLHKHFKNNIKQTNYIKKRTLWLKKQIFDNKKYKTLIHCDELVNKIYEKGYSCLDIIELVENSSNIISEKNKYKFLIYVDKIRKEYRNEKIIILNILNYLFMRPKEDLENILNL